MPRQPDGTFQRFNSQYYGSDVWQQDLDTDKKIIALRHDIHDEDLATGISECLPKDGAEAMLGPFNMGGFTIDNLQNATIPDSGAAFGQTVTNATWDGGIDQLTLVREGMNDLVVTIPIAGDGTPRPLTGVQKITAGIGIGFDNGNVMDTGNPDDTISLLDSGVSAGSYTNPNMSVDSKGRITSITNGVGVGTDLSTTINLTSIDINSSTGQPATLFPAIPSGDPGLMTGDQAQKLEDLSASNVGYASGEFIGDFVNITALNSGKLYWQRIGDVVTVFGRVRWSSLVANTNNILIAGLPYNVYYDNDELGAGFVARATSVDWGGVGGHHFTFIGLEGIASSDMIGMYMNFSLGSASLPGQSLGMIYSELEQSGYFDIQFIYRTVQPIDSPN